MPSKKETINLLNNIANLMEYIGENPLKLMLLEMVQTQFDI